MGLEGRLREVFVMLRAGLESVVWLGKVCFYSLDLCFDESCVLCNLGHYELHTYHTYASVVRTLS